MITWKSTEAHVPKKIIILEGVLFSKNPNN